MVIHGSAMWVFFDGMNANQWSDSGCSAYGNICQVNMAFVSGASSTFWYNAQSKYVVEHGFPHDFADIDVTAGQLPI